MASQPPFSLLADPLGAEQRTTRPLLDFDVGGAFHYLHDEGLSTPDATKAIAEKLAQEARFDAAAAFKEGFTSEQIISKLTGIEKDALGAFARAGARGVIEGGALSLAIKYGGPLLRGAGKLGEKLPGGPYTKVGAKIITGVGLYLGTLEAGKVAADQLIEEKQVLPSDLRYKVAGETAGLFAGTGAGARHLLKKIPDVAKSSARTSPWWAPYPTQKLLPKLSPEGAAEATRQVNLGAQKVLANAGKMRRRAEAAKQAAVEAGETIVYNTAKGAYEIPAWSIARGAARVGAAGTRAGAAGTQALGRTLQAGEHFAVGAGKLARSPGSFYALQAATLPAVSIMGGTAEALFPGNPWARGGFEVVGGTFLNPTRIVAPAIARGYGAVRHPIQTTKGLAAWGNTKRSRLARDFLNEQLTAAATADRAQGTPVEIATRLMEAVATRPEVSAGIGLTPAQILGTAYLSVLQAQLARDNPALAADIVKAGKEGLLSLTQQVQELKEAAEPASIATALNIERDLLNTVIEGGLTQELIKVAQLRDKLTGGDYSVEDEMKGGRLVYDAVNRQKREVSKIVDAAGHKVDKLIPVETNNLIAHWERLTTPAGVPLRLSKGEGTGKIRNYTVIPKELKGDIQEFGGVIPGEEVERAGAPVVSSVKEVTKFQNRALTADDTFQRDAVKNPNALREFFNRVSREDAGEMPIEEFGMTEAERLLPANQKPELYIPEGQIEPPAPKVIRTAPGVYEVELVMQEAGMSADMTVPLNEYVGRLDRIVTNFGKKISDLDFGYSPIYAGGGDLPTAERAAIRRLAQSQLTSLNNQQKALEAEDLGTVVPEGAEVPIPVAGENVALPTTTGDLMRFRSEALRLSRQKGAGQAADFDYSIFAELASSALDDLGAATPARNLVGLGQPGEVPAAPKVRRARNVLVGKIAVQGKGELGPFSNLGELLQAVETSTGNIPPVYLTTVDNTERFKAWDDIVRALQEDGYLPADAPDRPAEDLIAEAEELIFNNAVHPDDYDKLIAHQEAEWEATIAAQEASPFTKNELALAEFYEIARIERDVFSRGVAGDILARSPKGGPKNLPEQLLSRLARGEAVGVTANLMQLKEAMEFAASGGPLKQRFGEDYEIPTLTREQQGELTRWYDDAEYQEDVPIDAGIAGVNSAIDTFARNMAKSVLVRKTPEVTPAWPDVPDALRGAGLPARPAREGEFFEVDPVARDEFMRKWGFILDEPGMEGIKLDLENYERQLVTLNSAIEGRSQRALEASREVTLGVLMGVENPGIVFSSMINSENPEAALNTVIRRINAVSKEDPTLKKDVQLAWRNAAVDWAFQAAGGYNKQDFQKLYDLFFDTKRVIPTFDQSNSKNVMAILRDGNVVSKEFEQNLKKLIGYAENIQNSTFPGGMSLDEVLAPDGFKLFTTQIGGAFLGSRIQRALPGTVGGIAIPAFGSKYAVDLMHNIPNAAFKDILIGLAEPGNTAQFAEFLKEGATAAEQATGLRKFFEYVGQVTLATPIFGVEAIQLTEEATAPEYEPAPPLPVEVAELPDIQPSMASPSMQQAAAPPGSPPAPPMPSPQGQPAPQPPPGEGVTPQRSQYAAIFPNDPISGLIRQQEQMGIAALMQQMQGQQQP